MKRDKREAYRWAAFIDKQSNEKKIEIIQYSGFKKYYANNCIAFGKLPPIKINQIKGLFYCSFEELFILTKDYVFIPLSFDEPVVLTKLNPFILFYYRFLLTISSIQYKVEDLWQSYKLNRKK